MKQLLTEMTKIRLNNLRGRSIYTKKKVGRGSYSQKITIDTWRTWGKTKILFFDKDKRAVLFFIKEINNLLENNFADMVKKNTNEKYHWELI